MSVEFNLGELKQILRDCREYKPGHPLGRPFMSAYQIAIRFAEAHPQHPSVKNREVGGQGRGPAHSLAQRIAIFLSKAIKDRKTHDIEGGFLSHDLIGDLWFDYNGQEIRPSGSVGHSVFRWVPKTGAT